MKKSNKILISEIKNHLSLIDELYQVFISGSTSTETESIFSDLDLWIIFREEVGLKVYLNNLGQLLPKNYKIETIEICTPTHFFLHLADGWQIDLNLATAAVYHSLSSEKKSILIDSSPATIKDDNLLSTPFLTKGISLLERSLSKFEARKYTQVVRFSNTVRDQFIIPLLSIAHIERPKSIAEFDISQLKPALRKCVKLMYPQPSYPQSKYFLYVSLMLVKEICYENTTTLNKTKIDAMLNRLRR